MAEATPSRREFADRINAAYKRTVEGILEIGQTLAEAKDSLPHGQFQAMVKNDLPFGPRQAERYLAIAKHPVLANATCTSHFALPASVSALYNLSRFEPDELTAALREISRTKQKFDDETDVAMILIQKDIKRRIGHPEVTVQGVMAAVNKIAAEVNATPPPVTQPEPAPTKSAPPPKVTPIKENTVAFPEKAKRMPDPGIADAEIKSPPPAPAAVVKTEIVEMPWQKSLHELDGDLLRKEAHRRLESIGAMAERECRDLALHVAMVKEGDLWRKLADDWDGFCLQYFGRPAQFVDNVVLAIKALDARP